MRMGCAESLARPKIAMIEKMTARVQMKTEPRIAPPAARHILNEKCASIVLTRWPLVRLKSNAKKIPIAATIRRNAMGGMCCCAIPGKKHIMPFITHDREGFGSVGSTTWNQAHNWRTAI